MNDQLDIRELAVDRTPVTIAGPPVQRHIVSRYVLPGGLILGFLCLILWASTNLIFPPQVVTVVPVFSTRAELQAEGTSLFQAAGWVEPRPTPVRVAALAPGVIEKLLVVEDQFVKKGEPIAELVKEDAQLAHDRAQANLQLREAEVEEANATLAAAQIRFEQPVHLAAPLGEAEALLAKTDTEISKLPFKIRQAEADHETAQKDYEGKFAAKQVVAGVEIEIAKNKMDSAVAHLEELHDRDVSLHKEMSALTQRRNALQTQLNLLTDEIEAKELAQAKVKAARARADQARIAVSETSLHLDRMTVRSPIEGRVYRLIVDPGARIGSGMTQMNGHDGSTVVVLYRPQMLQARVDVRFQDIPNVSLNQSVQIDNPALSAPLTGQVLFISSEADIQKNTLEVKVQIPDPPPVFKPDMLVDAMFLATNEPGKIAEQSEVLKFFLMQQLIHQDELGSFVWLADQSAGVAQKVPVRVGTPDSDGLVEVIGDLTVSSRVITRGMDGLQHGDRITIRHENTTPKSTQTETQTGT
ncbi:MAG: HlyD family efflux transporter periplasmic adaptor subunit [Pirellulaceae bacterium]|nr:HlyD family efflux transporter periplasmic adaptor subunit [Pirellulaceae bacterium]